MILRTTLDAIRVAFVGADSSWVGVRCQAGTGPPKAKR
jgi:hypothetical protein